jgi:hypothetical protein
MVKGMLQQWHCDGLSQTKTEDKPLVTHKTATKQARKRRM